MQQAIEELVEVADAYLEDMVAAWIAVPPAKDQPRMRLWALVPAPTARPDLKPRCGRRGLAADLEGCPDRLRLSVDAHRLEQREGTAKRRVPFRYTPGGAQRFTPATQDAGKLWPRLELLEDRGAGLEVGERRCAVVALRRRFGALPEDARLAEAITDGACGCESPFPASFGRRKVAKCGSAGAEPGLERWTQHLAIHDESELVAAL